MNLGQEADCGLTFSEIGARETMEAARTLLARAKDIFEVKKT